MTELKGGSGQTKMLCGSEEKTPGICLQVPPIPSSNQSYEYGREHIFLIKKHEIHYEFLLLLAMQVDTL